MKFAILASLCVSMVVSQRLVTPKNATRDLPADVLRDFPGACFASTACRVFQVDETWPLSPFCGQATCLLINGAFVERVEDCGPRPKPSTDCAIANEGDVEKVFPACCPQYTCQNNAELQYYTVAELQEIDDKRKAAAATAAPTA